MPCRNAQTFPAPVVNPAEAYLTTVDESRVVSTQGRTIASSRLPINMLQEGGTSLRFRKMVWNPTTLCIKRARAWR